MSEAAHHHPAGESIITDLYPKTQFQFVHGDTMTVTLWEFEAGAVMPSHTHPHEQITHCTDGVFELTVGSDVFVLQPGDTVTIPSGAVHSASARTPAKGVDTFHPVREDYRF
jgi:quercetin dioxygenase-like cupin family protein